MMVSGRRSAVRILSAPSNDIPKVVFSTIKSTNKDRRPKDCFELTETDLNQTNQSNVCLPTADVNMIKNTHNYFPCTSFFSSGVFVSYSIIIFKTVSELFL